MINRLALVLARELIFTRLDAETVLEEIAVAANVGPASLDPLLVLGGTGVVPLRDEEDAHVLEVAHAGRARILATANFKDFVDYRTEVVNPGRIAIQRTADHEVIIAHPAEAAAWIRTGEIVLR